MEHQLIKLLLQTIIKEIYIINRMQIYDRLRVFETQFALSAHVCYFYGIFVVDFIVIFIMLIESNFTHGNVTHFFGDFPQEIPKCKQVAETTFNFNKTFKD